MMTLRKEVYEIPSRNDGMSKFTIFYLLFLTCFSSKISNGSSKFTKYNNIVISTSDIVF